MDLFDAPFYWGRVTRQDAEEILSQCGIKNGLYLIRERFEEAGVYAITLCYLKRFYHYRIERLANDHVYLGGSRAQEKFASNNDEMKSNNADRQINNKSNYQIEFAGPMELIYHFQKNADPLITCLTLPCRRPSNHNFIQFWCVPLLTPEMYVTKIFREAVNHDTEIPIKEKLTYKRYLYERRVLQTLHENESWFHSRISRHEAENRLKNAGAKSGLFLVREKLVDKRSHGCYSLSLCFQREFHHYIIQETANARVQVASANKSATVNRFGSIVQLIDFYYRFHQDLACPLRYACTRPGGSVRIISPTAFLKDELDSTEPDDSENEVLSSRSTQTKSATANPVNEGISSEVARSLEKYFIDEKFLIVGEKLGEGQFGEVYYGKLIKDDGNRNGLSTEILQEVAVKRLRYSQESFVKELYNEGQRMLDLDHPCIVKIFGVCKESVGVSLVLELCQYGAMNRWLRSNKTFRMSYILNYMYQVSAGMNYLHEKQIVHRDLALRNILIMSKHVCKISDFGLSRVIAAHNYYVIGQNRRLPSIWYPPEVLETPLFHSQIDIWSFGVTMWEATSYGQTPYKQELEAMSSLSFLPMSQKLLKFLQEGYRLKKPTNCPQEIYDLMLKCWEYDKHQRPTFAEIKAFLTSYAFKKERVK